MVLPSWTLSLSFSVIWVPVILFCWSLVYFPFYFYLSSHRLLSFAPFVPVWFPLVPSSLFHAHRLYISWLPPSLFNVPHILSRCSSALLVPCCLLCPCLRLPTWASLMFAGFWFWEFLCFWMCASVFPH